MRAALCLREASVSKGLEKPVSCTVTHNIIIEVRSLLTHMLKKHTYSFGQFFNFHLKARFFFYSLLNQSATW